MRPNRSQLLRFFLFFVVLFCGWLYSRRPPLPLSTTSARKARERFTKSRVSGSAGACSQRSRRPISPMPVHRARPARCPKFSPASKWSCTPAAWIIRANCGPRPTATFSLLRCTTGKLKFSAASPKTARRSRCQPLPPDSEQPFGIAFYPPGADPQWIYIADTDAVMRFPYRNGDLKARGAAEIIVTEIFPGANARTAGPHHPRRGVLRRWQENVHRRRIGFEHRQP